jgi:ferrous iron transport protein B
LETLNFLLTGNPNCGKTTLFNALTGARQKVGNWGGVTVDITEGHRSENGRGITFVDLPGTYTLAPQSFEERVALDCLLSHKADLWVNVIDSSNLERNLYLTVQLLEMERPMLLVFNMADEMKRNGITADTVALGRMFGVPIVMTVGRIGVGVSKLVKSALEIVDGKSADVRSVKVFYGKEIEEEIAKLSKMLNEFFPECIAVPIRWYAVRLLENDPVVKERIAALKESAAILEQADKSIEHLTDVYKDDPKIVIAEQRYGFVNGAIQETVKYAKPYDIDVTEKIDDAVTHPLLAYVIFGALMWTLFTLTFKLGEYPMHAIERGIELLTGVLNSVMTDGLFKSLLVNGIVAGMGGVLVFLPNIMILFFGISLMEDTGYMARAAFIMDKVMHKMGLHGKSFIPMVMGLGCNVPAMLAARTLESKSDRILTILIAPLISCSARLPIYVLFASAFFPNHAGSMVFLMYTLSFSFAFVIGILFRKILFKGSEHPFVMELPPYRVPTLKSIIIHMWEKAKHYLSRIGTVILLFSIVLFYLSNYPKSPAGESGSQGKMENTWIGKIGKAIEPVLRPAGFDDKMGISLLTGFVAKEMVVGTIGVLYASDDTDASNSPLLREQLKKRYTPLVAFCFMLFSLLYTPCMATVVTMVRELQSRKWAIFGIIYPIVLAWVCAVAVYQIGIRL